MMIVPDLIVGLLALSLTSEARSIPGRRNGLFSKRQLPGEFNPNPSSGFDDPTIDIADPAFATAIQAGYQGPMASYENHPLVGPVDLLRNGNVNFGVVPNFTTPLYAGVSLNKSNYWYIVTDSSDEGKWKLTLPVCRNEC
jgi:hypothetical protein